jgi:hypothetical protein
MIQESYHGRSGQKGNAGQIGGLKSKDLVGVGIYHIPRSSRWIYCDCTDIELAEL